MKRHILCLLLVVTATTSVAAEGTKPGVTILATGGTIAGASNSNTDTTDYVPGNIGINALVDGLPELKTIANVRGEQFANMDSNDFTQATLLSLARAVNRHLANPATQGVVVTHGTDTLEETAFFLDLTTISEKPVVMTGAMRPATAISADGPMNLLQAVSLAASPHAEHRGTMVVMNDRIGSAYYTTKTNTTAIDTFRATEQGYLGMFIGTTPQFYYSAATPTGKLRFDITNIKTLPKVDILYMHDDQDNTQIDAAIRAGAKGIVVAGGGNGSVPTVVRSRLVELTAKGYPVIRASRTGTGFATPKKEGIGAGILNPQKARILLMLMLSHGDNITTIRKQFEGQQDAS